MILVHKQCGQALTEYLLIAALVVVILVAGNPSSMDSLLQAISNFYANFTYAISLPSIAFYTGLCPVQNGPRHHESAVYHQDRLGCDGRDRANGNHGYVRHPQNHQYRRIVMQLIVLFSLIFGLSVALSLYGIYRIFTDIPQQDRTYLDRPPLLLRLLWPLVDLVAFYFGGSFLNEAKRAKIQIRLTHAAQDYVLNPDQFFAAKIVSAFFGAAVVFLILHRLHSMSIPKILLFGVGFYFYPDLWIKETTKKRNNAILKALPFYLDVITLSVEGGLNLTGGLSQALAKGPVGHLKLEFQRVLRDIRAGKPRTEAMRDMANRIELPAVGSMVSALIQAETMGVSLGPVLRAQADQRRSERFLRAEKQAMEAPVKMLAPLVMFIFPNTFLILGFPIVMKFMRSGIL